MDSKSTTFHLDLKSKYISLLNECTTISFNLEYFDLEWESVSSTEGLEELNFLKYLNLAWTEVPEQECRDLAVILSETEVLCYHDTQGF